MRNKHLRRFLALLMVLLMTCAGASASGVKAGETISSTSKWINSDIIGAVDEHTNVSVKDDFHTAVNLEWLLSQNKGEEETLEGQLLDEAEAQDVFSRSERLLYERKMEIVLGDAVIDPSNADAIGLSSEWLAHDLKLVQTFSSLSGEWVYRNAYGVEPARAYIEAIEAIETMEDLTAYLLNEDGMNITCLSLVDIDVEADPQNEAVYMAVLMPNSRYSLTSEDQYTYIDGVGIAQHFGVGKAARYLLGRLGYAEEDVEKLLTLCYRFEGRLAQETQGATVRQTQRYANSCKRMTVAEISDLAGGYPTDLLLAQLGLQDESECLVYETDYFRKLGKLYQSRYLDEIKAMLMVHAVVELLPLLDEEAYEMAEKIYEAIHAVAKESDDDPVGQNDQELADKEKDIAEFVFTNYLQNYLPGPMDQIYVAAHCTPQLKAEIRGLIDDIIVYYREMIMGVQWLSESAREATVKKLDHMVIRCVYPDQFVDYTGLDFKGCRNDEGGTLPQAVAAINRFHQQRRLEKVGQSVERSEWDMSEPYKSTTVCNACYIPTENSINILAGILTEEMYAYDMPFEKKLATVGTIVGHEITHAFDTTGYRFDKDGHLNPWWSTADVEAFDLRASRLIKYYNALTPYPGALMYSGHSVSGEVIADMGGVKSMLGIAEKTPGFDYDLFFRSYAQLWRTVNPLEVEQALASSDPHPLNFLRTNVTLMQFDEFYETYDIAPGDGMYMDPKQRISVW